MYQKLQQQLVTRVREFLRANYSIEPESIVVDQPPKVELGEYALPIAFELAKKLRKPPRKCAEELVAGLGKLSGFEGLDVAGAGYINARLHRPSYLEALVRNGRSPAGQRRQEKVLVEHTSINPNKAAHIGHLRNAILGDTFVRLLRSADYHVDIQNYIDNTGVQVADVVVGFQHLEGRSLEDVKRLIEKNDQAAKPFDYYCWDLYARVSEWYEKDPANKQLRLQTLHALEQGGNESAQIGEVVSIAVLRRHLETMQRLGIVYDFLPRESEILHLHFWESAFQQLKEKGVLYFETEGKNKGCWVMKRASSSGNQEKETQDGGPDEDAKVIVRSNGTVTYVGKDIAYHLWKFGLLGRDFGYRKFYRYPDGHDCWISAESGEADHPHFGGVSRIYNVIDSRQTDPQNNVIEAIRALGYTEQASHYTHFSYEMVALTPRCALELGYDVSEEDRKRPYIEVSGRKGFGVKADDLLDALIASAAKEVDSRHPELAEAERRAIAEQIAIGAVRYFMLKYTKNAVIAFDFKDALSFEGETGPYVQYAVVRATNIFRKVKTTPEQSLRGSAGINWSQYLSSNDNDIWELWLSASKLPLIVEQCIATTEPAYLAKYAFQLAQMFNNFYHKHHILTEADEQRKKFLLVTVAYVRQELIRTLDLLGIAAPEIM
ncbi:MAG TPA: arginine--tRNA ligase [Terriglobales bacterium]